MFIFEFKSKAAKEIEKLSSKTRKRILEKLKFFADQGDPLRFAEKLTDFNFGEYRFRIGDYRILFDVEKTKIIILKVGHRKDIYK
ncbi:type II toxin-antitoxin system RelE/ParE family toxin [Candidatus Gribaldobacteria bacterium]|nr:type II toxin-antitoxin system RelE/ParE family toxin [Candidatus Gribaldobacteria bacterium]